MSVAIVDVERLQHGDPAERAQVLADLSQSLQTSGAFLVPMDATWEQRVARACEGAHAFFSLPDVVKARHATTTRGSSFGYMPVPPVRQEGVREKLNVAGSSHPLAISVGAEHYPDEIPDLRARVHPFHAAIEDLGRFLVRAIAESLGDEPESLGAAFETPGGGGLVLIHYPPEGSVQGQENRDGAGPHADLHPLTLIAADVEGLELQDDGVWVRPPPGAWIAVQIGDLMQRWTNDRYRANVHRVVTHPSRHRVSLCTFMHPQPEFPIAPLPACVGPDRPARYPRTTWRRCFQPWVEGQQDRSDRVDC